MIEINPAVYSNLSEIAIKFGPFFFSLIFCLIFIPLTHKWYVSTSTRSDPAPSKLERKTYRFVFFGSFIFFIALISVCVLWWLSIQNDLKVIHGEIQDINDYIEVTSPNVYLQALNNHPYKNISYVFLYDPQKPPKNLRFQLRKDGSDTYHIIDVKFDRCKKNPDFKYIETDSSKYFKEIAQYEKNSFNFFPTVYAATIASHVYIAQNNLKSAFPPQEKKEQLINPYFVERLQDDRTPVGEKIKVLNYLVHIEDQHILNEYMYYTTAKEPFIITLSDLQNHTDKEIASLSRRLLEKVNAAVIISDIINQSNAPGEVAGQYLLRLDEGLAREVINQQSPQKQWANEYKENINAIPFEQNKLHPVGSIAGDRFYVKATWDRDNADTIECLTRLFNRTLSANRSIEEERDIMISRSYRIIYGYSKEWALNMAQRIEDCGGSANFVAR